MNIKKKLSLEITFAICIFFILFGILFLFIFSDSISIKDFFHKQFEQKEIFWKSVVYFYWYVLVKSFILLFGIYALSYFFICRHFTQIESYNKKLKDYNHYLAHELKTPIAVVTSNLDVLKYGFDEDKITNSQEELKNMVRIINGLLNFSEAIQISNKSSVNLENFINKHIYFLETKWNIFIHNKEFNFHIETDEVLLLRIVKNLIENALKYSLDWKLDIFIQEDKLVFENKIFVTLTPEEIQNILKKFYSQSYRKNKWNGIGLPMIQEIVHVLWYKMEILSFDNKFRVEIKYQS